MLRKSLADYYAILGLQPGVSPETIKRAYRAQVRQWHPDKFTHDCRLQQKAEAKLKDINEAYAALRDLKWAAPSYAQPSSAGQNARTHTAGNSSAGRTYTAGSSSSGRTYTTAGNSSSGRAYTAPGSSSSGKTYTTPGTNSSSYQSTRTDTEPRTTWHSAPVPPGRRTSQIPRWAPIVFLYGLLLLANLFNSTSSHSAPATFSGTPPTTPQFIHIKPLTSTQTPLDQYNWQDSAAPRKKARVQFPTPLLSDRDMTKLQRELFDRAAQPQAFKRKFQPVPVDWPSFKIVDDTPAGKQEVPVSPSPVQITPSVPK